MDKLIRLYIEPTSDCNLHCEMCFRHTWFNEKIQTMDMDCFYRIIETLPDSVETIFFGGMGEPLFHPNIIEMVDEARKRDKNVELLTNGTLLHESMIRSLLDAGLSKLWISIDQISPKTGSLGHQDVDLVVENIKSLQRLKHEYFNKLKTGMTFVVTKSNIHDLSKLPVFMSRYGFVDANVSNVYPSDHQALDDALYHKTLVMGIGAEKEVYARPHIRLPYMDFDLKEVQDQTSQLIAQSNHQLSISGQRLERKINYCKFVQEGMAFVRSDGEVSPCMALLHNGKTVLGDTERITYHRSFGQVMEKGIGSIWSNQAYKTFRKKVVGFEFPPCINCGHCDFVTENIEDCFGNDTTTCGACLWAEGLLSCP